MHPKTRPAPQQGQSDDSKRIKKYLNWMADRISHEEQVTMCNSSIYCDWSGTVALKLLKP